MSSDLARINAHTREKVTLLLTAQCTEAGSRNCGGFVWDDSGYADSRNAIYAFPNLFAAYLYPDFPEWHGQPAMLERLRLALGFMQRRQRHDGTVMLGISAAPGCAEVGFTLPGICATYERVAASTLPGRDEILPVLEQYLRRGAAACRTLRPHTANHRWTACAGPLACVDRLFPEPGNRERIADLLDDGLDCDSDGFWFEERSPGYNNVANWGMLYLADHFGARHCLDAAYRNYRNILRFIQPNGEADSTFSHRQDRGAIACRWGDWWLAKRLAVEYQDGELATAADLLLEHLEPSHSTFVPLRFLMDDARFRDEAVPRKPLPTRVELRAATEPIWRWRDGAIAATVVADHGGHFWDVTYGRWGAPPRSNTVMSLHHGQAVIDGIKLTWGAGSGGFRPEHLAYEADGAMLLTYRDHGQDHVAHYRPRQKWDWANLPYDQQVQLRIERLPGGGFRLHIAVDGEVDVPVNLQFLLREGGRLTDASGTCSLTESGRTFSAGGDHLAIATDGSAWRLRGLPPSAHRIFTGDGSHIGGIAERRCHRLLVGAFTPFHASIDLLPERCDPPPTIQKSES